METLKLSVRRSHLDRRPIIDLLLLLLLLFMSLTMKPAQAAARISPNAQPTSDTSSVTIRHSNAREINSFVGGGDLGDPYLGEFDKEWAKMSGRLQSQKCVDIPVNLTLCQNIGYERMMLPNLLQHDSLTEVTQQARSWVPLLGLHCHPDTKVFLCSLFSPVCLDRRIYPCRTLCEGVRDNCLQRMAFYGFDWPKMLNCSKFPEDNDLCIKLIHDVKPDNNCTACKHPMTYEAIVDNYCRAEFVSRVKIQRTEIRGGDKVLHLKKSKRNYKTDNLSPEERDNMAPVLLKGASCACDVVNDTSKKLLLMGGREGDRLVVKYVVEFANEDKDFRRAFKEMIKEDVCKNIIEELSQGELASMDKGKVDGSCMACKLPMTSALIVENYCLADFVLRVSVTGTEARDGHQALLMKKRRKNYKKGALSRKEVRSLVPLLEGSAECKCPVVGAAAGSGKQSRFLIFGSKRDDKHIVTYVTAFDTKNKDFKKGLRAIRKGDACINILRGGGLGSHGLQPDNSAGSSSSGKGGKGGKRAKKGKNCKKRRKGKKGESDKKGKNCKKGKKNKGKKKKRNRKNRKNNAEKGKAKS